MTEQEYKNIVRTHENGAWPTSRKAVWQDVFTGLARQAGFLGAPITITRLNSSTLLVFYGCILLGLYRWESGWFMGLDGEQYNLGTERFWNYSHLPRREFMRRLIKRQIETYGRLKSEEEEDD